MRNSPGVYRRRRAGLALLLTGLVAGGALILDSTQETGHSAPKPSPADALTPADTATEQAPKTSQPPPWSPTRITIPAIAVNTPLIALNADKNHTLQPPPPQQKNLAGWYQGGTVPGHKGTAVIAAHLDTPTGPAAFYRLSELHKTNTINVQRQDGSTAIFTVYGVEQYEKTSFPSDKVYAQATRPELRLITCAGTYSKKNSYSANTVVYAHLTSVLPPTTHQT
ncbi:class F sortase [Streptomyces sp. NPDC051546]|uniref:class F sortase n=1 Tax=Streptomyces sp. NPDC051546 TaxID=3365655 RepID=UPI00378C18E7